MAAEQAKVAVDSLTQSGTDITPLIENDVFSAACWMIIGIALVMLLEALSGRFNRNRKHTAVEN